MKRSTLACLVLTVLTVCCSLVPSSSSAAQKSLTSQFCPINPFDCCRVILAGNCLVCQQRGNCSGGID
ncbi:MAG TPA: hypothetical protein VIE43_13385 [Thermoanaerobaculia bacterium]|nr:hypothetical protein [Thermoanaerobaculia bacterium]